MYTCITQVPKDACNWEPGEYGLPKWLEVTYRWWKGHAATWDEAPFIIWRNPADSRFCLGAEPVLSPFITVK